MPPTTKRTTRGRSGNPAVAAEQDKYAPTVWLSGGVGTTEDVVLPSGQLVLLRRPGVEGLIKAGVLRDMDSLSALVNQKHIENKDGRQTVNLDAVVKDDEQMASITRLVDKVMCYCVLKPEITPTPDDATRRKPGVVYADMVELLDKMYIFQFVVGGTRDLESFRSELNELLGGVEAQQGVPGEAE